MKYLRTSILGICLLGLCFQIVQAQVEPTIQELSVCDEPPMPVTSLADLSPEERKEAIIHILRTGECEYKGIVLKGKVQYVTAFPDIEIQYVDAFPDIRVQFVDAFPDECGEWQKVESFPDFKVQIVDAFPDVKVQIVDSFPGVR